MKKIFSALPVMKKIAPVLLVSAFLLPSPARAEIKAGSLELSPFMGYSFFEDRQNLKDSPIFGGRIGYNFTDRFGVEATGQFSPSRVDDKSQPFTRQGQFTSPMDDVDVSMYHVDLLYHFMPKERFNPFLTAGYGVAHYSPNINTKSTMSAVNAGVGAKYWVAENVALRVDVRDNMIFDEHIHNMEATAGVVFRFGGTSHDVVAKAVPAQPVAPQPQDGDRDGVYDALDKCPGTPSGVAVDKNGCPPDSDRDGVADYLDKCPGTPAGVAVDKNGCPPDSDRDGVADYLDKCPGTLAGVAVDKNGCPPAKKAAVAVEPEVVVLAFEDIHFDFDQSTLKPEAKTILKRNIALLKENPKAQIRIAGYTSAAGTDEYNQKLSERRADAVRTYLVEEGVIGPDRLTMIGYGESRPAIHEPRPDELRSDAARANIRVLFEITVK